MSVTYPLRHPETRSEAVMRRRGWWLVVANLLLPGSAQVLAGNRRFGRIGIVGTLVLWAVAILLGLLYLLNRAWLFEVFTQGWTLVILQGLMIAYCVLWVILTLDTLRLVRLVKVAQSARSGIAAFTIVMLVALVGGTGYGSVLVGSARGALGDVFGATASEPPVDGRYNIMLLGGDAGPDREGLRPDSMSVVSIDAKTGKAVNIGLPRNLDQIPFSKGSPMLKDYPDGYGTGGRCDVDVCMLNSIYTEVELYKPDYYPKAKAEGSEPGIEAMRDALEGATGLKIQYYVLIDMQGFSDLIDALGGVTIDVKEKLPIGGLPDASGKLQGVEGWIEPGVQHMDGKTAQWYARSRETTSDYDRMARQRQLEEAMLAQMNPANVLAKFQDIAKAGSQVVKTDVPQSMLGYFVDLALKTKKQPVVSLDLVPPLVPDPTNPDWDAIHGYVQRTLKTGSPTPTPAASG
ncbi:LCP family protein [Gryllotalpicola ginsengisoli]|uniref:LCP family protein n=1 Tax=Gryllotalpicola ginsengisoli TaxID=444608 RepID=UPI0003B33A04|nr:LCP family protein [Gryllotalpicola ginsengisoli]